MKKFQKIMILNLPYVMVFYLVDKGAWLFRHCIGNTVIERLGVMLTNFSLAFLSWFPSLDLKDLTAGIAASAILKLVIVYKGKNAKKFRQGEEYGSGRWGSA